MKAAAKIGGIVAAILLLYVLSTGPVYAWNSRWWARAVAEQGADRDAALARVLAHGQSIKTLYAPLIWLSDRSPAAQGAFRWYLELWEPAEPTVRSADFVK